MLLIRNHSVIFTSDMEGKEAEKPRTGGDEIEKHCASGNCQKFSSK